MDAAPNGGASDPRLDAFQLPIQDMLMQWLLEEGIVLRSSPVHPSASVRLRTSLTDLLADARMATALTLLQATTQSVSQIALSVGDESPSRFAVRFRHRFGFAPTAVRGHGRAS